MFTLFRNRQTNRRGTVRASKLKRPFRAVLGVEALEDRSVPTAAVLGWSGGSEPQVIPTTLGWSFTAQQQVTVNRLGVFDDEGDGLVESHVVGIWTGDTQSLLGSATVPGGTVGILDGGFRYVDLQQPITLVTGHSYVIGAAFSGNQEVRSTGVSSVSTSAEIHYDDSRHSGAFTGFSYPDVAAPLSTLPAGCFGPNFQFEPAQQPDLAASSFHYRVVAPVPSSTDGPLPFNAHFVAAARVANTGQGAAGSFNVSFYASRDPNISTSDVLLGQAQVASLAAGASIVVSPNSTSLQLPQNLDWTGQIYIGVIIDPNNQVGETNETNNANQGVGLDFARVQLYDPIAPRETWLGSNGQPLEFGSRAEVYRFLASQGYQNLLIDNQASRSLPLPPTISRYNGRLMPAGAFRIEAYPVYNSATQTWRIVRQIGEPSPGAIAQWGFDYLYVLVYHWRF